MVPDMGWGHGGGCGEGGDHEGGFCGRLCFLYDHQREGEKSLLGEAQITSWQRGQDFIPRRYIGWGYDEGMYPTIHIQWTSNGFDHMENWSGFHDPI